MTNRTENEEQDLRLLSMANEKGKFALQVGYVGELNAALERGMDESWFTLIDISPNLEAAPNRVMRVFKLTAAGVARRETLRLR